MKRRRPEPPPPTRTLRVVPSAAVVVLGTFLVVAAWSALHLRDPLDHATGHAIAAVAAAAFFVLAVRYWPAPIPRAVTRAARLVLAAGFALFALAQGVEGVGAFDLNGGRAAPWLDDLHGIAMYPGTLGIVLVVFGALSSLLTVAAAKFNLLDSRWMLVAFLVPVTAVVLFVAGAFIFGY